MNNGHDETTCVWKWKWVCVFEYVLLNAIYNCVVDVVDFLTSVTELNQLSILP